MAARERLLSPLRRARPAAGPPELARWVRDEESGVAAKARSPVETVLEDGESESR